MPVNFSALGKVAGIGGIALGVLLLIYLKVAEPTTLGILTPEQAYRVISGLIILTFGIAALAIFWGKIAKSKHSEYIFAALFVLALLAAFVIAITIPVPPEYKIPPGPTGPISGLPPAPEPPLPPTPLPIPRPKEYGGSVVTVQDKNGKAATLVELISNEFNWALGKVDQVELRDKPDSLSNHFKIDGLRKYLEQFDAIIGVGTASNEMAGDNNGIEELRALDRAFRIQYELKRILSPPQNIAYYTLSLGRNKVVPDGASDLERKRNSAEQRRVIILGIKQQNEKVDVDSILTKKVFTENKLLKIEQYSKFLPELVTGRLK